MTKFEAKLEHLAEYNASRIHMRDHSYNPPEDQTYVMHQVGRPLYVPEETWAKACSGDLAAIREANRLQPGCIYDNVRIMKLIRLNTALSLFSYDKGVARRARNWLLTACVPVGLESRRNGVASLTRAIVGPPIWDVFENVYRDIILIRSVLAKVYLAEQERLIRTHFPELLRLEGATGNGGNRKTWLKIIKGGRTDAGLVSAQSAAVKLLIDVTGYKNRKIHQFLLEHLRSHGTRDMAPDVFRNDTRAITSALAPLKSEAKAAADSMTSSSSG